MIFVYLSFILQFCYIPLLVLVGFVDSTKWNKWMIMSVLFLLFQSECVFSFSCLIALAESPMLNKSGKSRHYSWTYRESMQSFTSRHEIICRFSINALYVVEQAPFHSKCAEFFNWEWKLDFVRYFFCTCWDVQFFFFWLMWWVVMIDFWVLNQSYTLGINPAQ